MTTGNEKLGIQLEVEPIQAGMETFAALQKALETMLDSSRGMAQAQAQNAAAARETTAALKEQRETVSTTKNAFKDALKLDLDTKSVEDAKKALQSAIAGLQNVLKADKNLNIKFVVGDNIKENLEKQLEKDKSEIARYQKEMAELFKSVGTTESKAGAYYGKVAAGGERDPAMEKKLSSIAEAYARLDDRLKATKTNYEDNQLKLANLTNEQYEKEISFAQRLLAIRKQLETANDHQSLSRVKAELETLQALSAKSAEVARAIELLDRVHTSKGVTPKTAPAVEPVIAVPAAKKAVATSTPLIDAEQLRKIQEFIGAIEGTVPELLSRLQRVQSTVFTAVKSEFLETSQELQHLSDSLNGFLNKLHRIVEASQRTAVAAVSPAVDPKEIERAGAEFDKINKKRYDQLEKLRSETDKFKGVPEQTDYSERQLEGLAKKDARLASLIAKYKDLVSQAHEFSKFHDLADIPKDTSLKGTPDLTAGQKQYLMLLQQTKELRAEINAQANSSVEAEQIRKANAALAKEVDLEERLNKERAEHIRNATLRAEPLTSPNAAALDQKLQGAVNKTIGEVETAISRLSNVSTKNLVRELEKVSSILLQIHGYANTIHNLLNVAPSYKVFSKEDFAALPIKEIKEANAALSKLEVKDFSKVNGQVGEMREKFASLLSMVNEVAERIERLMKVGGVSGMRELAASLRAAQAAGSLGSDRYLNRDYSHLTGAADSHVSAYLAQRLVGGGGAGGSSDGGGGDGTDRGKRGRYYNRDYSHLMEPDNGQVRKYFQEQDEFLAKQIANAEKQQRVRDDIERAQASDDAKTENAARRRLQRLQEIYGTRMMKSLDKDGLTIDNGQVVVAEKTYTAATEENERRKQAAIRRTAEVAAEVAAERIALERKLSEVVFSQLAENRRRSVLGKPEVLFDASPVTKTIEGIKDVDSVAAARDALARLKREIRAQSRDLTVELKIGVTKEGLERATEQLKKDYDKLAQANPSYKFPAIDFGMGNFKGPLSEVQQRFSALKERVTEAKAQFQEIKSAEEKLGSDTVKILQRTEQSRISLVKKQQAEELELRRAFIARLNALEEDRQRTWNKQAGTEGVKYKAFGHGFVRANMNTELGTDPAAYKLKYDTDEARSANTIRNINKATDSIRGDALKGLKPTIDSINKALEQNHVNIKKLNDAELGKLQSGLRKVNAEIKDGEVALRAEADSVSGVLQKMGRRLVEFYSIRTVLFAIGNEFRTAFTGLLEFNQGLHDTIAIAGAAPASLRGLQEAAIDIAKTTKFSAKEVTDGMKVLAQAGVEIQDIPSVTRVTALLATGSGATFEQASQVLTTGMNVWKANGSDAIQIANTFTAALNASKLEIGELGTAFNYLASQSALSGRSLVETTALIAVLKNQGQQASTIGTSMSNFLGSLLTPNKKVKAYLEAYKINPEDVDPTKKTLVEIVKAFEDAASRTGISVKDLFKTFDKRVARGTATLFQAGSDDLLLMEERIKNTNAAATAWAESMKGATAQINVLRTEFAATMQDMVSKVSSLTQAKDAIRDLIVGLRDTQVQAALATTAIAGIGYALLALARRNGPAAALTAITLALGYLATKAGAARRELANLFEGLSKDVAESSGKYQRTTDILMTFLAAVSKAKVDPKTKELVIDKKAYEEAIKLDSRFADPSLLKDKKKLIAEIKDLMSEATKGFNRENDDFLGRFNANAAKLDWVIKGMRREYKAMFGQDLPEGSNPKAILEAVDKASDKAGPLFGTGQYQAFTQKWKTQADKVQEAYVSYETGKTILEGKLGNKGERDPESGITFFKKDANAISAVARMPEANSESQIPDKSPNSTKRDPNAELNRYISEYAERESAHQKAIAAIDRKISDLDLKDKTLNNEEVAAKNLKIQEAIEEEYAAEHIRLREKTWNKIAKAAGGTYDSKNNVIQAGVGVSKEVLQKAIDTGKEDYSDALDKMNEQKRLLLEKSDAKAEGIIKLNNEKFEKLTKTLEEDSLTRQMQGEIKALEVALRQRGTTWEDKVSAFEDYKAAVVARYSKEKENKFEEFSAAAKKVGAGPEVIRAGRESINKGFDEKMQAELLEKEQKLYAAPLMENVEAEEKHQSRILETTEARLNTSKLLAWSAQQVNSLQVKGLDAETSSLQARRESYNLALNELRLRLDAAKINDPADATGAQERLNEQIEKYNDKLGETAARLQEIARQRKLATQNLLDDFISGVQDAWLKLSDTKALTQQFGSSVTNTAVEGTADSLASAFGTLVNPDTEKIKDLKLQIQNLQREKAQTESDIRVIESNTVKTPQEIANLADKRAKLNDINNQLDKQKKSLGEASNAWTAFAEGMKGVMKTILAELTRYVAKLLIVWAMQKLTGLAVSAATSGTPVGEVGTGGLDLPGNMSTGSTGIGQAQTGGLVSSSGRIGSNPVLYFDAGGLVPFLPGADPNKDSVRALVQPGEFIFSKDAVSYFGPEYLARMNRKQIQKFAEGGLVGGSSSGASTSGGGKQPFQLTLINVADPTSVPKMTGEEVINIVSFDAAKKGAVYKTIKGVVNG